MRVCKRTKNKDGYLWKASTVNNSIIYTVGTNSFVSFSVEGIDLSDYRWHIPNSWSALSGLNGPELIVVTGNTPGNYHVEVTARSCGVDVGDFVNITVNRDFVGGGFFATARGSNQFADYETINAGDLTNEIDVYPNPVSRQLQLIVPNGATNWRPFL